MRRALKLHPDTPCEAVSAIEVELGWPSAGTIQLIYRVTGAIDDLRIPAARAPERADDLWQHSCFEIFLRPAAGEGYLELNFSPSRQWAAYRFESHRSGRSNLPLPVPPRIGTRPGSDTYVLEAELDLPADEQWRVGLSAVIEEASGRKSYWALEHPPGEPDFHHPDCFALELAPPAAP